MPVIVFTCNNSSFFRIKEDDKLIQEEGVDSLSEAELREDCRERGMLGLLSVEEMRQQVFVLWTVL
jgi:LETM1 and EF-hand domain-containing protein 1